MTVCGKRLVRVPCIMECDRCDWRGDEVYHGYEGLPDGDVEPVDVCPNCGWYVVPQEDEIKGGR